MKHGFVKIAAATPLTAVANCKQNAQEIISIINKVKAEGAEIVLFPELCITSCSCGDLYYNAQLQQECEKALQEILTASEESESIIVVGAPVPVAGNIYNCAIALYKGKIAGITAKNHPTAKERRWFSPAATLPAGATVTICGQEAKIAATLLFTTPQYTMGIEIGSDATAPIASVAALSLAGAEIIANIAATSENAGHHEQNKQAMAQQSRRCICAYAHTNAGYGESTATGTFAGYNAVWEKGSLLAESARFETGSHYTITEVDVEKLRKERRQSTLFAGCCCRTIESIEVAQLSIDSKLTRTFNPAPFIPSTEESNARFEEIFMIQSIALAKRIEHTRSKSCVIGISGGLDSTLALLVTAKACDILGKPHSDIITITMPGFGTSNRTYNNAWTLMKNLGTTIREISIAAACTQHFADIEHDASKHDITFENAQARERTQILMDVANQCSGIVIGTGDLSELALGWATYNGDHMSMYGVNASVPKTLMQHLVRWAANNSVSSEVRTTLLDIVDTPISPELTPADEQGNIKQKTEDLVGPYELHDFFIYNHVRYGFSPAKIYLMAQNAFAGTYDNATIKKWLTTFYRRFFTQQFKRSCMPDGPKVGSCNLSTQEGWQMPSDTAFEAWTAACEQL